MNGKIWNKLSGIPSLYQDNEEEIKKLLLGRAIEKVNGNTLKLDNGLVLEIQPNQGCCCGAVDDVDESDGWSNTHSYKIFVYAENTKIKLLQVDGDDGNGYYGTGYEIVVKGIEDKQ